jgi:hypothetical protein
MQSEPTTAAEMYERARAIKQRFASLRPPKQNDAVVALPTMRVAVNRAEAIEPEVEPDITRVPTRLTLSVIARHHEITVDDLTGKSHKRMFVHPRQIAMYLIFKLNRKSYPEIGRVLGGRDHTTAMHGVRVIEELVANDEAISAKVDAISQEVLRLYRSEMAQLQRSFRNSGDNVARLGETSEEGREARSDLGKMNEPTRDVGHPGRL